MRILHTSDWHIGAELEGLSREDEHEFFFDWLVETLQTRAIDVLLIAGDVFHQENPSAAAQQQWYRVLTRLAAIPTLRQIVVIGGNHDSASRLEAPREILAAFKVHVVGGWSSADRERVFVPIAADDGSVSMVVVAVPYVSGHRIGVSTFGKDVEAIRAQTVTAFTDLYTSLAHDAKARWPGAAIVGMGHLTCEGAQDDDYQTPLHHVGTIAGLPGSVFCEDYAYVALGHIHRAYPVSGSRARYSGSPIGLRFTPSEMAARRVVFAELNPQSGECAAKSEEIPRFRELRELRFTESAMEEALKALTPSTPGGALVQLVVLRNSPMPDAQSYYQELAPALVRVVSVRFEDPSAMSLEERFAIAAPAVHEVTPERVFDYFFQKKIGREPLLEERLAFEEALQGAEVK